MHGRMSVTATAAITLGPWNLIVSYNAYSDPGQTSGPPENCYPPDSDLEITEVRFGEEDVMPFLSDTAMDVLADRCWDDAGIRCEEAAAEQAEAEYQHYLSMQDMKGEWE